MKARVVWLSLVVAAAAWAGEPETRVPYTWLCHLETLSGPVNGPVDATFRVIDTVGVEVDSVANQVIDVVDGDIVVDLLLPADAEGLSVEVTINGVLLNPALPLALEWPSAASAEFATEVASAASATRVGDRVSVLSRSTLEEGRVAVPLARVVGFPSAFIDGDQGLDFTAGSTLEFVDGTLQVRTGSLPGTALAATAQAADLAAGTITTEDFRNNSVLSADFQPLPIGKLGTRVLTGRHLAGGTTEVFAVVEPRCLSDKVDRLSTFSTCTFTGSSSCVPSSGGTGHRPCAGLNRPTDCFPGTTSACPNSLVGVLVLR